MAKLRKLTADEVRERGIDTGSLPALEDATGEAGSPGPDPYKDGAYAHQDTSPSAEGDAIDMAKSWANKAARGAGPQIEGAMAAVLQGAQNSAEDEHAAMTGDATGEQLSPRDAYRDVRKMGENEHARAERTRLGSLGGAIGSLSTPVPVKALGPGASIGAKAAQGAKVGGALGLAEGAATSQADLTQMDTASLKRLALDALFGGVAGAGGGAATGATFGSLEPVARSTARKLPMDMLGVGEAARRSMQRQGVYDKAGDELLALSRPLRSGMRKGSLTEDALAELQRRGESLDDVIGSIDAKSGGQTVTTGGMSDAIKARAKPFESGSLQDAQVAKRINKEADNVLSSVGSTDPEIGAAIPLAEAEAFKQRFGPAVGKQLRHAGEPAAKTDALAEVYRGLKEASESGAQSVDPALAARFVGAKDDYRNLAAPLSGANVERSGMRSSDFDFGDLLSSTPTPGSGIGALVEKVPVAGPAVVAGANALGRAYGYGTGANLAEFAANRMVNNSGGALGAALGAPLADEAAEAVEPWSKFTRQDEEEARRLREEERQN